TFARDTLVEQLGLKPLNEMDDIHAYGNEPRVKCKNLVGPWQEIQIAANSLDEIDTPEFWQFLEKAVEGFGSLNNRKQQNPEDVMPWKVLGQKWHLARKGFAPGKRVAWPQELLEELLELLGEVSGGRQFLWNNKVLVHLMAPGKPDPWATVVTKRLENVELVL